MAVDLRFSSNPSRVMNAKAAFYRVRHSDSDVYFVKLSGIGGASAGGM